MKTMTMQTTFKKQLEDLLDIHAPSGKEKPVRRYLKPILDELMDSVEIDTYGNLLATKTIGNGRGAVVMLSAHMDTVRGVQPDKIVIEDSGVYTAQLPSGKQTVLGADDRAGIAIVLEVIRNIPESFNGVVKVAFSREEEIGCVGAERMNPSFYQDVDLAIVCDRKGSRDIVAGSGYAFCSNMVGQFLEGVGELADMDYKCVEGGTSDACTFSESGINSVNLSVGYYGEHTAKETLVFKEMRDTAKLIVQAFAVINDFYSGFGKVPESNKWVKAYSFKGLFPIEDNYVYNDDFNHVWVEQYDDNGEIFMYDSEDSIILQQGENDIIFESQDSFIEFIENAMKSLDKRF